DNGRGVGEARRLGGEQRRVEGRAVVRLEVRAGVREEREAAAVRVVDDQVVGDEVVVAFDLEVVGVPYSGALDGEDAVPPDARVDQLGAPATARGRGDTVALAQRGERPPALRRQQRMLGGGDDAPSAQRRQTIDAATTAGGGAQHTAPEQCPALVARQAGLDALDTMD